MKFSREAFVDRSALLLVGVVVAAGAWAFHYITGEWATLIITLMVIGGLLADNHRLRKALRASEPRDRE